MAKPNLSQTATMTAGDVLLWLERVLASGVAASETEAAELIGKSHDTLLRMKMRGADKTTALACNAVLSRIMPFGDQTATPQKRSFHVTLPLTVTVAAEGYDSETIRSAFGNLLGTAKTHVKVTE